MKKYFLICLFAWACPSLLLASLEKEHSLAQKRFDAVGLPKNNTLRNGVSLFNKPVRELNVPQAMVSYAVHGGVGGMTPGQVVGGAAAAIYAWNFLNGWNFLAAIFLGVGLGGVAGVIVGGFAGALIGLGVGIVNKFRRAKAR